MRWWNGTAWGDLVQPAPQPLVQPGAAPGQPWGGGQPAGQQWGVGAPPQQGTSQPARSAPAEFAKRNTNSLVAGVLVVLCVLIAATMDYVVFAIVPAVFAARAVQAKEPLAWPATGIAAAVLIWRFLL
jgi:hypothetical protein